MADTTGKCTNFASCTLAYRNQPISYTGNPVCPECGQPLSTKIAASAPSPVLLIGGGAGALLLLAVGLFFAFGRHKSTPPPPTPAPYADDGPKYSSTPAPEPATPSPSVAVNTPSTPVPDSPSTPIPSTPAPATPDQPSHPAETPSAATPPAQTIAGLMPAPQPSDHDSAEPVSVEKTIDTTITGSENQKTRAEVLKRIDLIPNLSAGDRQKLYARVDRAHGMGKVITIPFAMGSRAVGAKGIEQIKSALQSPQVANLIKDPTVVFVLLGFADKSGDEKANQKISVDRAENISQTLKEKCGMQNVTQAVGMGGSTIFDAANRAKNRVVEVWAVVP